MICSLLVFMNDSDYIGLQFTWIEEMQWTMHFLSLLDVSACGVVSVNFWMTLHDWKRIWWFWMKTGTCFWGQVYLTISFGICWIDLVNFTAWLHVFTSQDPATVQSFLRNNKLHSTLTSLVGCEKSRFHVCRGFLVFWVVCFLADANTAVRTCVSTG